MGKTIDDMIKGFEENQSEDLVEEKRYPVTFWIPQRYKEQYDVIQAKSKRRLGKLLTEIITKSIDRIAANAS